MIKSDFNQKFWSELVIEIQIIAMKLIKMNPDLHDSVKNVQKRSKIGWFNWFSIQSRLRSILNLIYFNRQFNWNLKLILLQKKSKINHFNWKRSKSSFNQIRTVIGFLFWLTNPNCRIRFWICRQILNRNIQFDS